MKECYGSHKGMGIGISYVVIHVHVYKKFFQVFLQRSSVCHPVVPSGNLPFHWSCLSILKWLSGVWSLSELKDRHVHTGLGGVCVVL